MEQKPLNLGFFFGAGAEKCFGLPDGGEFAIKLFNRSYSVLKEEFKEAIEEVFANKDTSPSYIEWLDLEETRNRRVYSFGKTDFNSVVESSAEQKKDAIIKFCQNIDSEAQEVYLNLNKGLTNKDTWNQLCQELTDKISSQDNYAVEINKSFEQIKTFNEFFKSNTFELMMACMNLDVAESGATPKDQNQTANEQQEQLTISEETHQRLFDSFKVIMYMINIAFGDDVKKKLKRGFFSSKNAKVQQLLDEVSPIFNMDIGNAADHIFDFIRQKQPALVEGMDVVDRFSILIFNLSYRLCTKAIDYQMLVDSLFKYIMNPKIDWTKFTKMMLFLRAAYDAITESNHLLTIDKLKSSNSYYKDIIRELQQDSSILKIKGLGSANYNDYYGKLVKGLNEGMDENELKERFGSISRLNGGVGEFYNPYKNSLVIISDENFKAEAEARAEGKAKAKPNSKAKAKAKAKAKNDKQDEEQSINRFIFNNQLITPFFFTQSGTKPMTSIDISCRYADLYRNYQKADAIVVIGFNFNSDDSHINTIFRYLVEKKEKTLISLSIDSDHEVDTQEEELCKKLRIDDKEAMKRVKVLLIDKKTRFVQNEKGQSTLWLDYIIERYKPISVSKVAWGAMQTKA